MTTTDLDPETCYRAASSRDRRFDGMFYVGVTSTGIYCRPSCPARTPARRNMTFHPSAASAQTAGFRACKRCLPDAVPGSPAWDVAADLAGRSMRLIADGVVDREGVDGLAQRLGYTSRHLNRVLVSELGAGPAALARARRVQIARVLIETSDLGFADVAFAAGFSSVRQFNDTVREVYDATPSMLRARASTRSSSESTAGGVRLRVPVRTPFAGEALWNFLAGHAVEGVECVGSGWYARTVSLPHGHGTIHVELADAPTVGSIAFVPVRLRLSDLRDTSAALERVRRLLDADCDPVAVDAALGEDHTLGPLVAATPGLRVPGQVDGEETALRTVIGQQVSVAGARTVTARLVRERGVPVATDVAGLTHLFPSSAAIAQMRAEDLPMPRSRGNALIGLAHALATGAVRLDRAADRAGVHASLMALRGIGSWTADYVAMRALADPDVLLLGDVGVRNAWLALGRDMASLPAVSEGWSPWRSYALMHLWHTVIPRFVVPENPVHRPDEFVEQSKETS
ncbi:AlkA N-terminal domain-containing protein [Nocardioides sp. R-C-SC26]|uniref:AlkA N-terminal domain-containing protein n=1 Tax=Nocardioides sp. R-C-SC26 TaxID=2870414 RepID=UPI001E62EEED|nr:AlkA N-terminal domain-containing protein [Nocardioides sp. R-C-SC26]